MTVFRCFSIASTKTKRRSPRTAPTRRYGSSSFNSPRTNSLVSSSKGSSNIVSAMYSALSSSVSSAMLENTYIVDSASVFLFVLLFEMTGGICQSVGGVCVFFVVGVGRIVFVGGGVRALGGVAAVILSRFCCLFRCFSIASTILKRHTHHQQTK